MVAVGNRYDILEQLGAGGMGNIFRAYDRLTGTHVALKRLALADDNLMLAQEFRTLARLRHPHIVSVLDYGFDILGAPFITMELVENARTIMQDGYRLSLEGRVQLLIQALQALEYLHRNGIYHRDVKPGNILVTNHQVKLLDFGLATRSTGEIREGLAGTLLYMAPELFNEGNPGVASDLYAIGVIAYELLTARLPYPAKNVLQLIHEVTTNPPDLTPLDRYPALKPIVGKLLEKDPERRYRRALDVTNALAEAMGITLAETTRIRDSFLQSARFVGREEELNTILDACETMYERGQGAIWFIGGESGVGKSRLLEEIRINLLVAGMPVFTGQAIADNHTPFFMWRDILRQVCLFTEITPVEAGILSAFIPDVGQISGVEVVYPPDLEPGANQQRLLSTIEALFRRLPQPPVLLLEDLQWANESLLVLQQLARLIEEVPVLLVCTYRDEEMPHLPDQFPGAHRLKLPRFGQTEVAKLVASMLGTRLIDQHGLVDMMTRETEGNPLFIIEVVRALADEHGTLEEIGVRTIPASFFADGIQTVIEKRLTNLPDEIYRFLQLAAVAGRAIDPYLLSHLTEQVESKLQQCTAALDVNQNQWRFAHDKFREYLLSQLDTDTRLWLNERVAEAIELAYPDDPTYTFALVQHWTAAGNGEQALRYAIQSAYRAFAVSNFTGAINYCRQALESLAIAPDVANQLFVLSARAYESLGKFEEAIPPLQRALHFEDELSVEARLRLGSIYRKQGTHRRAYTYLLEALDATYNDHTRAEILYELATLAFYTGNNPDEYLDEAYEIYDSYGDFNGISQCTLLRGMIADSKGQTLTTHDHYEAAIRLAQYTGNRIVEITATNHIGELLRREGDYPEANNYFEKALALGREIGDDYSVANILHNIGRLQVLLGDFEAAKPCLLDSLALAEQMHFIHGVLYVVQTWGMIEVEEGNVIHGVGMIGCTLDHPQATRPVQDAGNEVLHHLYLVPEVLEAGLTQGKVLANIVEEILDAKTKTG